MTTASIPIPSRWTLDGFVLETSRSEGVSLHALSPLTTILVRTRNSVYRIILLQGSDSRVLIQGGPFFPDPIEAHLAGSTFGGSLLKTAWIGVGLHMEIHSGPQCIVTSPICRIRIQQDQDLAI